MFIRIAILNASSIEAATLTSVHPKLQSASQHILYTFHPNATNAYPINPKSHPPFHALNSIFTYLISRTSLPNPLSPPHTVLPPLPLLLPPILTQAPNILTPLPKHPSTMCINPLLNLPCMHPLMILVSHKVSKRHRLTLVQTDPAADFHTRMHGVQVPVEFGVADEEQRAVVDGTSEEAYVGVSGGVVLEDIVLGREDVGAGLGVAGMACSVWGEW
ncbi:hypothetical protein K469DRAFT_64971 [Zopfia rhizophila CBS 207.26]|uniref:Uncharacterized protein n=1 Tax=Zopfia rhizophila CBS 207.26 TaxID=1314779 RepID=A0A6A6D800_9PEZI|nr:hypothetical protein K469DRAFT_64971 [Zopfia rhizophila CBS 207.26]